jgi:hypothetical protein
MSSFSIPLPLDDDGFLRRECPHCSQQFKWHHGPTAERPQGDIDPPVYFCPLCGASAAPDQWYTQDQISFIEETGSGHAIREISDMLEQTFSGTKGFTYHRNPSDEPEPPAALQEPNDMVIITPPCHPWEPIKVPEETAQQLHCLICGTVFAA